MATAIDRLLILPVLALVAARSAWGAPPAPRVEDVERELVDDRLEVRRAAPDRLRRALCTERDRPTKCDDRRGAVMLRILKALRAPDLRSELLQVISGLYPGADLAESRDPLIALLASRSPLDRIVAVKLLGTNHRPDKETMSAWLRAAYDSDLRVRIAAVRARNGRTPEVLRALGDMLLVRDDELRELALTELADFDDLSPVSRMLVPLARHWGTELIPLLGRTRSSAALPQLERYLDAEYETSLAAVSAIVHLADWVPEKDVVPLIEKIASRDTGSSYFIVAAARGYHGLHRDAQARRLLKRLPSDHALRTDELEILREMGPDLIRVVAPQLRATLGISTRHPHGEIPGAQERIDMANALLRETR